MSSDPYSEYVWHKILDHMEEAVVIYDKNGGLTYWNKKFKELYGYADDELSVGIHFAELGKIDIAKGHVAVGDDIGDGEEYLARKAGYRKKLKGSFFVHLKDGRWIKTTDRRLPDGGFVSVQTDITELRQLQLSLVEKNQRLANSNAELQASLDTDFLTGALSRKAIISKVEDTLAIGPQGGDAKHAMLLDLDHFKAVNDTHGHLVGDQILQRTVEIARNMSATVQHFGRMGGDEFLGIITLQDDQNLTKIFEEFQFEFNKLCSYYNIDVTSQRVGLSAGFTEIDTKKIGTFHTLYQVLDKALYQAKDLGKNMAVVV